MEMTQEEMKHNILDWAKDVSVAVESFARDIKFEMKKSTVEADLQEAKSSAKKLIKKIDEYLESLKPKFEVKRGDVVYLKGYDKNIFLDSGNIYKKHNFIDGDAVLVKTAEEVNEWLGAEYE